MRIERCIRVKMLFFLMILGWNKASISSFDQEFFFNVSIIEAGFNFSIDIPILWDVITFALSVSHEPRSIRKNG